MMMTVASNQGKPFVDGKMQTLSKSAIYIRKIVVENLKCLERFEWELGDDEKASGWHVWLGDNGSGKTALIRGCAAATVNPIEFYIPWPSWIRQGCQQSFIHLSLWKMSSPYIYLHEISLTINKDIMYMPDRVVKDALFSSSFGPFRRFSGGKSTYEKEFSSNSASSRILSAFGEDVALTEVEPWLQKLRFAQLEGLSKEGQLLDNLIVFINQPGFLPNGVRLKEVTSKAVTFVDAQGNDVEMNELSDGFRSILSLAFELIRQMSIFYKDISIFNEDKTAIIAPGVVFVDEIDVHLHPRWQRAIGPWLTRCFPKVQFFVTTHSLLVCQGAYPHGSVWRLPDPDPEQQGNPVGRITGVPLKRLLFGNLLEVVSSGAFGTGVERSDEGRRMLEELSRLNRKSFKGQLSEEEKTRRRELMEIFGASDEEELP